MNGYGPSDYGFTKRFTVVYPGKLISKSNTKARYLPKRYRDFEDELAMLARVTCGSPMLKAGWVVIRPVYATRTHIDPANAPKSVTDALVKGGVMTDDKAWAVTVCPVEYGQKPSEIEVWA